MTELYHTTPAVHVDTWSQCYNGGWQGLITPSSFSHPAKFSRSLIQRIYQHVRDEGWLKARDTCVDCFGGVSLGAHDAALQGVQHIAVELEPRFHALALENIALWQRKYGHLPQWVTPVALQGDSRQLRQVVQGQVDLGVSSPPFIDGGRGDKRPIGGLNHMPEHVFGRAGAPGSTHYGEHPTNLGNLPPGSVTAAIASPPYANGLGKEDTYADHAKREKDSHRGIMQDKRIAGTYYGSTPGNLGNLPPGQVEACVSSPPWENQEGGKGAQKFKDPAAFAAYMSQHNNGHSASPEAYLKDFERQAHQTYGTHPDQLGNTHGQTFWEAARLIVAETYALLKPGGHAVWVVKAYVRDKALVDFPGDWQKLCESCGFVTLHEHQALLTEDYGTQGGLFGTDTPVQTARKSFFRRLAEAKGSPSIDHETVYCMVKPPTAGPGQAACCVASPPYAGSLQDMSDRINWSRVEGGRRDRSQETNYHKNGGSGVTPQHYGTTPGQLGAMPTGPRPQPKD